MKVGWKFSRKCFAFLIKKKESKLTSVFPSSYLEYMTTFSQSMKQLAMLGKAIGPVSQSEEERVRLSSDGTVELSDHP